MALSNCLPLDVVNVILSLDAEYCPTLTVEQEAESLRRAVESALSTGAARIELSISPRVMYLARNIVRQCATLKRRTKLNVTMTI